MNIPSILCHEKFVVYCLCIKVESRLALLNPVVNPNPQFQWHCLTKLERIDLHLHWFLCKEFRMLTCMIGSESKLLLYLIDAPDYLVARSSRLVGVLKNK